MSDLDALIARAWEARQHAYAPYSRFLVGAALATDAGVFTGANVENASYGLSICAERSAATAAASAGARQIEAVAVVSSASGPASPCGACRQFLFEFGTEAIVVSEGMDRTRKTWRLADLLPDGFGPSDLQDVP